MRKLFILPVIFFIIIPMLVSCKNTKTPKSDTQNLTGISQSDWHNAAEKLLLPMLSIFGIDTAGNENSETIITFELIDTDNGLRIVYYDKHGKIIDETTAPFLTGDSTFGWAYAHNFKLYDLNKDGIPEIVIKFVYPESAGGFNILYIYADGDYNIAWEPQIPFPQVIHFFTDSDGNTVAVEGIFGGLRINRFKLGIGNIYGLTSTILDNSDKLLVVNFNDNMTLINLLDEPLTPIEPLDELQQSIMESIKQKLFLIN